MILNGGRGAQVLTGSAGNDIINGFGAGDDTATGAITATRVATGLALSTFAGHAPGDASALYITEKNSGRIVHLDLDTGATSTFLDIPANDMNGLGEGGLLSFAFHPDYAINGKVYVYVANAAGDIEIRSYQRSESDPSTADVSTKQVLMTIVHTTHQNHYGGQLQFGPDGYLYISTGDGGSANDPAQNAQNIDVLLGKILRIDVDSDGFPDDPARNYSIPASNPFAGATAGADEIFSYGLRNPWRMSFDSATGDLWIGDVGQGQREEIDRIAAGSPGGQNFGWRILEGTRQNFPGDTTGMVPPVFEYNHTVGRSITGGYVYHGPSAGLGGSYVFADFATNRIFALLPNTGASGTGPQQVLDITSRFTGDGPITSISSFGVDAASKSLHRHDRWQRLPARSGACRRRWQRPHRWRRRP